MKLIFASNFEQFFACAMLIDLIVRSLEAKMFISIPLYGSSVLLMASLIKPNLRNNYFLSYILYIMMIYGPTFVIELFELEFEYTKIISYIAYAVISYLIIYEGQYYIIEETGPYGVGRRTKIVKKDGYSLTLSIFYPIDKKVHIESMKDKIMTDVWYTSGYTGVDSIAKVEGYLNWLHYQK